MFLLFISPLGAAALAALAWAPLSPMSSPEAGLHPDSGHSRMEPRYHAGPLPSYPEADLSGAGRAMPLILASKEAVWCTISIQKTPAGLRLTPRLRSAGPITGRYALTITQSDANGSSDVSQTGQFSAGRDREEKLGASEFRVLPGTRIRAELRVQVGGHEVCHEVRS